MQLLLSLIAIIALAGFAWALGFRSTPLLDDARALAEAEGVLPGFRATGVALADNGRGALVCGADGTLAVVWPLADGWIARRLDADKRLVADQKHIRILLGEPMRKSIELELAGPLPAWLAGRVS